MPRFLHCFPYPAVLSSSSFFNFLLVATSFSIRKLWLPFLKIKSIVIYCITILLSVVEFVLSISVRIHITWNGSGSIYFRKDLVPKGQKRSTAPVIKMQLTQNSFVKRVIWHTEHFISYTLKNNLNLNRLIKIYTVWIKLLKYCKSLPVSVATLSVFC